MSFVIEECQDWHDARTRHARSLTEQDLYEECSESLLTAVQAAVITGESELVGRVLMAAVNARLSRAADRAVYGDTSRPDSEDAAAEALQADLTPLLRASLSITKGI